MALREEFSIGDVCLSVSYADSIIANQMPVLLRGLGVTQRKNSPGRGKIFVEFLHLNNSGRDFSKSTPIGSSGSLNFFRDRDFLYVSEGKSIFGVDLRTRTGISFLHDNFWQKGFIHKFPLICIGLILLLWQHDFHELHAACLSRDENGLLLVGPSGSGKSTLAYTLIRAGWKYLSDDLVILKQVSDLINSFSLRRIFKVSQDLISSNPELENTDGKAVYEYYNERFIYIDELFDSPFAQSCTPRMIIFPTVTHENQSKIESLKPSDALVRLVNNGGYGMNFEKDVVKKRVKLMKNLLGQTAFYKMSLGIDLESDPMKLVQLIPKFR